MGCASGKDKGMAAQKVKELLKKRDMSGLKFTSHQIRDSKNWDDLLKGAVTWINENTIVTNIFGISTIFCNYNKERLLHIRYDQAQKGEAEEEIAYEMIKTDGKWDQNQQEMIKKTAEIISQGHRIMFANQLEVDDAHDQCLAIIWYAKLKVRRLMYFRNQEDENQSDKFSNSQRK